MARQSREGTAPIADGDSLDASEVEAEFNKLFTLQDGNIDTTNLSSSAGIVNGQLAAATITGARIAAGTVAESNIVTSGLTTVSLATSATITAHVSSGDGANSTTGTDITNWANFPVVTAATLTPGAVGDMIAMDCTATVSVANGDYGAQFAFIVDGTGTSPLGLAEEPLSGTVAHTVHFSWMEAATDTAAITIQPRYRADQRSGSSGASQFITGFDIVFRAFILPIK